MTERPASLPKLFAKSTAAIAIAAFWLVSAVGTTIGTTVGVSTLATAINVATSTPAQAYRRWRGRRWRRGGWYGGYPYYRRYGGYYGGYPYYGYGYPYYRRRGWWGPRFGIGLGFGW
jgi:hypothetical protein